MEDSNGLSTPLESAGKKLSMSFSGSESFEEHSMLKVLSLLFDCTTGISDEVDLDSAFREELLENGDRFSMSL